MSAAPDFDLSTFLPYLLNQAADRQSDAFNPAYKGRYGMLRTEWRVLFHLGQYGEMTAKRICGMAQLHKTKASRAVAALEEKRFVTRHVVPSDRRHAVLRLTAAGRTAYETLKGEAQKFDAAALADFTQQEAATLKRCLQRLAQTRDAK